MNRRFLASLAAAQTGDGRPLPDAWRQRIEREWAQLQALELRLRTLRAERETQLVEGQDRVAEIARRMCTLRGVAEVSAAAFSAELFGTRTFSNGRQLGALIGLVPCRIGAINGCWTNASVKRAVRTPAPGAAAGVELGALSTRERDPPNGFGGALRPRGAAVDGSVSSRWRANW